MRPKQADLTEGDRCRLANEVFDVVFKETESFDQQNIGVALCYLLGAITDLQHPTDSYVDWSTPDDHFTMPLRHLMEGKFKPDHSVWLFVKLKDDDDTVEEATGRGG